MDHCNTGCLNSWLGDRYCDSSCRVPQCGYDAGDCGTENWNELLSYTLPVGGARYDIPLGTKALYFNLTDVFPNGTTVTSGEFGSAPIIRTSVISQKFKTLSLTLSSNVSRSNVHFILKGKHQDDAGEEISVNFTIVCDTQTPNKTLATLAQAVNSYWNFDFNHSESHSKKFLEVVAVRIQNSDKSINYWVTERPSSSPTPPPPTFFTNYTITNTSLLPKNVSAALRALDHDYHDGDLTEKGYMKKRAILLEPFKNLVSVNGTVSFGVEKDQVDSKEDNQDGRGLVGGVRKLLMFEGGEEGEHRLAEEVAIVKQKELNRDRDLRKALEEWEMKYGEWDPSFKVWESRRWLPWEKLRLFPEEAAADDRREEVIPQTVDAAVTYTTGHFHSRRLMADDTFADSLRHVNRLFTKAYGHEARKVPAHMPHFIQSDVMKALQEKFADEFDKTSSHRVRTSDDMQYAFSYNYFLMNEKKDLDIPAAFGDLDTDRSGILSVRELRTMLAKFSELPIDLNDVRNFEKLLRTCDEKYNGTRPSISPMEYETHYDPDLPLVTLDFTLHCQPLIEKINKTFTSQKKYKYEEAPYDHVAFKMISGNTSKVMAELDTIRKERKKFICLNDNIEHGQEGADVAKLILLDFYESLFPIPSQFELPPEYRNRFLHIDNLNEWIHLRNTVQLLLHAACGILIVVCVISLFYGKFIQLKRKLLRFLSSTLSFGRTRSTV